MVYLTDIRLEDFSISADDLNKHDDKIDVLLLTHYQGIPNMEYEKIIKICNERNILVIDDISQTENSYINNKKVGTLSNFAIRSFAFDKPFSCYKGGSLVVNNIDVQFENILFIEYSKIPYERNWKTKIHLKALKFLMENTRPENYKPYVNRIIYAESLLMIFNYLFIKKFLAIKIFIIFSQKIQAFFSKSIEIKRLRNNKVHLIRQQEENFFYTNDNIKGIEQMTEQTNFKWYHKKQGTTINWNRFSILDESGVLKNIMDKHSIEAGNYNWPKPLHVLCENLSQVVFLTDFKNSEFASKNILNIPTWYDLAKKIKV
jgi:dTDP-4-amino-4,6-dideoxygalactose transaminase